MGSTGHFWNCVSQGLRGLGRMTAFAIATGALPALAHAQDYRDYPESRGRQDDSGYDRDYGGGRPPLSPREARCQQLERQLMGDWRGSSQDDLRRIEDDLRAADRTYQRAKSEADRMSCYEDMFIFGRSLKRTPRCLELDRQIETAQQRLSQLQHQRDTYSEGKSRRNRQDDVVAELARNGCGENYARQHEANRRSSQSSLFSFWEDEEAPTQRDDAYRAPPPQPVTPYGAYRTMCVRLCDGFYFPISFSTSSSRFKDDEARCRDTCSAPAELYVYRNPGESVDQMVSPATGRRYTDLPSAFRNRKQYIRGCSCKADEYSVDEIARSEQALKEAALAKKASAKTPHQRARPTPAGENGGQGADDGGGQGDPAPEGGAKSRKSSSLSGKDGLPSTASPDRISQNSQISR